ncbi:MAG: glycosyltransferase family 39 protein, partial [Bacteroidota bacterium]
MKGRLTRTHGVAILLLVFVTLLIGMIRIESTPPLWWDEGWTLSVARNWVELGHYGNLLVGQPAPATMAGQFPVVVPIALSFKVFGVGIWQARLPGLLFTVCSLLLLYYLTSRLYNYTIAWLVLGFVLLLPVKWGLHPFFIGRQALGEMPVVCFFLAGFACFLHVERRIAVFLPLTVLFWGIALMTKEQAVPFFAVCCVLSAGVLLMKRQWRRAGVLVVALAASFGVRQLLLELKEIVLRGHSMPPAPLSGLTESVAVVLDPSVRISALKFFFLFGIPMIAGLTYQMRKDFVGKEPSSHIGLIRFMLWSLASSWFAWFILLSVAWERYAFPPMFMAMPFVAALMYDLTGGWNMRFTVDRLRSVLRARRVRVEDRGSVAATALLALMCFLTSAAVYRFSISPTDSSIVEAAQFLNEHAKPDRVVETYDSELFFLLNCLYHYPPPQMDVEYIQRTWLHKSGGFQYDPLVAD